MSTRVAKFSQTKPEVEKILKEAFPQASLEVTPGYQGRIHAVIVSPEFNGMTEKQKQDKVWRELKKRLRDHPDYLMSIAVVIVYGMDELH